MSILETVVAVLLIAFLYLAIGYILSTIIFDKLQKPTLLYYLTWPVIAVFYLFGAIGALICGAFLIMMYILSRPFDRIVSKMWLSRDIDFKEMSEQ